MAGKYDVDRTVGTVSIEIGSSNVLVRVQGSIVEAYIPSGYPRMTPSEARSLAAMLCVAAEEIEREQDRFRRSKGL